MKLDAAIQNRYRLRWREAVRDPFPALALLASVRMTDQALALLPSIGLRKQTGRRVDAPAVWLLSLQGRG